jgi:hypothetical protein
VLNRLSADIFGHEGMQHRLSHIAHNLRQQNYAMSRRSNVAMTFGHIKAAIGGEARQ